MAAAEQTPVNRVPGSGEGLGANTLQVPQSGLRKTPWQSRKYTPYQRTPAIHHIRGDLEVEEDPEHESIALIKKTWHIYKVTPLYKFSTEETDLKKYSKLLSSYVECESTKAIAVDNERADMATVTKFDGLRISRDDPTAMKFVLKLKPKSGNGEVKEVLEAYLCGARMTQEDLSLVSQSFTLLPILLIKGPMRLCDHLCNWIQMQFDCSVSPLKFSSASLSWMVAMWCGKLSGKRNKPVEIVYSVPEEVEGLSRIIMSIDPIDCRDLWHAIHDENNDEVSEKEIDSFSKSLEAHFHHYFKINLAAMSISRIGTDSVQVGAEGRIKIFRQTQLQHILGHMTILAMEQILA